MFPGSSALDPQRHPHGPSLQGSSALPISHSEASQNTELPGEASGVQFQGHRLPLPTVTPKPASAAILATSIPLSILSSIATTTGIGACMAATLEISRLLSLSRPSFWGGARKGSIHPCS